ncbi:hypothetical protein HW571_22715 [Agrobacterium genomosp. 3]|uniref:hypothetical protein n=1 Tax=Agrobacterium tomkonis TaxID=1183410 RepID=UPI001CD8466D|nr:hypothetical protein [Agrobacterium tomkonis]MCA1878864.1 hypothetical protein [Agrobacterium tumefaciens]MCA1894054.1 hypothetical protein [Agrobacterium tomkonis]
MSVKLETAYHEAGHIVLAWFSKYHTIAGGIDLTKGSGQIPEIAVSKSKMSAAKKLPSKDTASNDNDVVREAAVIFTAGYQAELLAASINRSLAPDRGSADLDYQIVDAVLTNAGLQWDMRLAEAAADDLLRRHWVWVEKIAQRAFERRRLTVEDLIDIFP